MCTLIGFAILNSFQEPLSSIRLNLLRCIFEVPFEVPYLCVRALLCTFYAFGTHHLQSATNLFADQIRLARRCIGSALFNSTLDFDSRFDSEYLQPLAGPRSPGAPKPPDCTFSHSPLFVNCRRSTDSVRGSIV